jgi:adenylate cyclase class IV
VRRPAASPAARRHSHRPADELEVKARVTAVAALRRALRRAGARLEFRGRMLDRRYDRRRELIRGDEVLRLRVYRPAGRHPARAVLGWKGPASARGGYRHRTEIEVATLEPARLHALLERLGYRVTLAIDRRVEVYRLHGAVLRLERYPRMDTLLEVEGSPRAIERAILATGIPRERFLSESLPYFTAAYARRTGRRPRLVRAGSAS